MKVITRRQAILRKKSYSHSWYYLRPEYEVHYNEQFVNSTQTWHHHRRVAETLFVIEGILRLMWKTNGRLHTKIVRSGAMIETDNDPHSLANIGRKPAKLMVIKRVASGKDNRRIFKSDKFLDTPPVKR
ncbi:MAG: cupin domain-containing protein [Patescibacteria group bacterium]